MSWLDQILATSSGFMPHGHCYLWLPSMVWLNVISDGLIFLAYSAISLSLLFIIFNHATIPFKNVYLLFSTFVFACGLTHLMEIINIWIPAFWISGFLKGFTAIVSVVTAVVLPLYFPKIRELIQKMLTTANLSSLGEMAGGIAHEINSPLTVILGRAERLKRQLSRNEISHETAASELTKIELTAERISKITQSLLKLSRRENQVALETVPLNSLISEAIVLCEDHFQQQGVTLTIAELPSIEVQCRSIQISQVILNLINNAFDAVCELSDKWVTISAHVNQQWVMIKIADSGGGIPSNVVNRMMDPFYTTKAIGKGTGLGLSIARGIIESHHGELYYDSTQSNTTFVIKLPIRLDQTNKAIAS